MNNRDMRAEVIAGLNLTAIVVGGSEYTSQITSDASDPAYLLFLIMLIALNAVFFVINLMASIKS